MKNKFITLLFVVILSLNPLNLTFADEFIFEVGNLEITNNGKVYKGSNRGKVTTDNQTEIISNNFEYLKKTNRLEANGNVILVDIINNIVINAEKIFYLKNQEKIYTLGKTLIKISDEYNIEGSDLTLLKNKMILFSDKKTIIRDNFSNHYTLDKFEYSINDEILKGKKIELTTNYQKNKSDKYFFETGFVDLKKNEFLAKNINVKMHKTLFNNKENDPRINAVSGSGNKFNSFYEKGVFTSCKKTDKCPPWKINAKRIHHDKVKKRIIYSDALLNLYDYPVLYFPKFFHPDPTVKRQSGFLTPALGSSNTLGSSLYLPYFHVISKSEDITVKPKLFDNNHILIQNEYRRKRKKSLTVADFSFANKDGTKSHFFTNTEIDLSLDNYTSSLLEINYEKTSNDNYLKLFDLKSSLLFEDKGVLESRIKLDLDHQNYDLTTSVIMYETLSDSNTDRYQYVLPSYNFSKNFNLKQLDGTFNFSSSGENSLRDTNVYTTSLTNNLNYNTNSIFFDNGIKTNFEVLLKNINAVGKNNPQYKESPQSELISAYVYNTSLPLIKNTKKNRNTLEPKLSFRFSPHDMKNNSIQKRRVSINNIYSADRLGMGNSFESGESLTMGLNFKQERVKTKGEIKEITEYLDLKLATAFRLKEEKNIPINSTLNKKRSNVFGQLNFFPTNNVSLKYDFSLTENLDILEYNSVIANFNYKKFNTSFNILEEKGIIGQTNIIQNSTSYRFDDSNSIVFNTRKNKNLNLTEYYDLVYQYQNDCLIAGIQYKKNYYSDSDIEPVDELFFTITIVPLTTFSPDKLLK
ncbi:organic solvent tolerance protein [Candidatus Pelagibacter sp.]|nr:organic solvent tolerance protein [Candidatus Pelagibacter sp.]